MAPTLGQSHPLAQKLMNGGNRTPIELFLAALANWASGKPPLLTFGHSIMRLPRRFFMATIVERTKISVPHLAKEWGVSTAKIIAFIRAGELRAINVATSRDQRPRYLIDRADIEDSEAARRVIPDAGQSTTQ
jgi:hypothetical protein